MRKVILGLAAALLAAATASAQPVVIPPAGGGGGGGIGGSIQASQVAVGSDTDTIGGSGGLTWTTNGFSSIANDYIQDNRVGKNYVGLASYVFGDGGTVSSPAAVTGNEYAYFIDALAYHGGSYGYGGSLAFQVDADDPSFLKARIEADSIHTVGVASRLELNPRTSSIAFKTNLPAPSGASLTPTSAELAGNVPAGTYTYRFTFSDSDGHETLPGAPTPSVTVGGGADGQIQVLVPYVCDSTMPLQSIYRSGDGGATYKLVHGPSYDCATSWVDNVAAGTTDAPTTDTSLQPFLKLVGDSIVGVTSSDWGTTSPVLQFGTPGNDSFYLWGHDAVLPGQAGVGFGLYGGVGITASGSATGAAAVNLNGGHADGTGGSVGIGTSMAAPGSNKNGGDVLMYTANGDGSGHRGDVGIGTRNLAASADGDISLSAIGSAELKANNSADSMTLGGGRAFFTSRIRPAIGYEAPSGDAGASGSGSSCTITAVQAGIITALTCAP